MKKILKVFIWIIVVILYLGMVTMSLIFPALWVPTALIPTLFIINKYMNYIKKKDKKENQIPQEVLQDFETAEREYEKGEGEVEPHKILWNIAKQKGGENDEQRRDRTVKAEEFRTGIRPAPIKSDGREDVQTDYPQPERKDDSTIKRTKRKRKKDWEEFT